MPKGSPRPGKRGLWWKIREAYGCGTCGVGKGQLCRTASGVGMYEILHKDRKDQYEQDKAAGKIDW